MLPFSLQLSFRHAVVPRYSIHALTFVLNIYNSQCKFKHKIHLSLNDEREREKLLPAYQVDHSNMFFNKHYYFVPEQHFVL